MMEKLSQSWGSRMMMMRLLISQHEGFQNSWQEVQSRRFSYAIELIPPSGRVKMIFSEFVFAEVYLSGLTSTIPASGFFT
jgi:hypothetical protein